MVISVDKYYNSDKTEIGVLVSPGYGAGFSTWYDGPNPINLAVDRRVIEYWLSHRFCRKDTMKEGEEEVSAFLETLGYHNTYCGGWYQLELRWVPVGKSFRITEYDGFETLLYLEDAGFTVA